MPTNAELRSFLAARARFNKKLKARGITKTQPETPGIASDIGNEIAIGGLSLGRSLTDPLGADKASNFIRGLTEGRVAALSPEQQAADQNDLIVDKKGGFFGLGLGDSPGRTVLGAVAQSVPSIGAGIASGGLATAAIRGTIAAAGRKKLIETGAKEALRKSDIATGAAGFAIGEGLVGGASNRLSVKDKVLAMTPEQLAQSPEYNNNLKRMTPDQARAALASKAATQTFWTTGATTALFGDLAGRTFGRLFGAAKVPSSRMSNVLSGAKAEGLQELAQGGAETPLSNIALQRADPTQDTFEGTLNNAVTGALAGGALGGAVGAIAPVHKADESNPEKSTVAADIDGAPKDHNDIARERVATEKRYQEVASKLPTEQVDSGIINREAQLQAAKDNGEPTDDIQMQLDALYTQKRKSGSVQGQTEIGADEAGKQVDAVLDGLNVAGNPDIIPPQGDLGFVEGNAKQKSAGVVGGKVLPEDATAKLDSQRRKDGKTSSFLKGEDGNVIVHATKQQAESSAADGQIAVPYPTMQNETFALVHGKKAAKVEKPKAEKPKEGKATESAPEAAKTEKPVVEDVTATGGEAQADTVIEPKPQRTLSIGRGRNGHVRVEFPDKAHADLYSLTGRVRKNIRDGGKRDTNKEQLLERFSLDDDKQLAKAANEYKAKINGDIKGIKEKEFKAEPYAQEATTAPTVPTATTAKVGDKHGVMGTPSTLTSIQSIDGVTYELHKSDEEGGKGHVRVVDDDSGRAVTVNEFKDNEAASAEFDKTIAAAQKASQPAAIPEGDIKASGDLLFKTEVQANNAIKARRELNKDTHTTQEVDGGFVIMPNKVEPKPAKTADKLTASDFDGKESLRKEMMDNLTNGLYSLNDKTFDSFEDLPDSEVPAEYLATFDKDGHDTGIIADIDHATKVRDFEEADKLISEYQRRVKAEKSRVFTKPAGNTGNAGTG
ncbi:MAG: hypothetical protein R8K20_08685, partial [Gallionellaceae bacterium]